jgi:hypothetical protein
MESAWLDAFFATCDFLRGALCEITCRTIFWLLFGQNGLFGVCVANAVCLKELSCGDIECVSAAVCEV